MGLEAVLERRRRERSDLIDRARHFVRQIESVAPLRAAVVFGSVARGDFNQWSDIDLLLVGDFRETDRLARLDLLGPVPPPVQPFVWTVAEWNAELVRGNPIVAEALRDGVWLAGSAAELAD